MAHTQLLHELLKEDQEPFHLKTYIADRKSQLMKRPSRTTTLHIKRSNPIPTKSRILSKHACFLLFHNSPDVRKSSFPYFSSPAKSPCKSPNHALFLHIPSRTAALLAEAAMRIQKQPKSQSRNVGFGLFGSFLKRVKDMRKNKKRAIEANAFKVSGENATRVEQKVESARISCSCSKRRLSSAGWTENNEDNSLDYDASTSSVSKCSEETNDDFGLRETRFCSSPFRFSLHRSPSESTAELCSSAASRSLQVNQEKENCVPRNSDNVQREEEEEKEQCSPVSVLDPPFEEDGEESGDAGEDDYNLECSYGNLERAKQQLLYRLRRFEKLAQLDPMELEIKLMEGSDKEDNVEREDSEDDEPHPSLYRKLIDETFVNQVFNLSSLQCHTRNMSTDTKRLVSDLIVEEKSGKIHSGTNDVVMRSICSRFDSWKEVEFDTIDMMIELDLKGEFDGWTKFDKQVEETAAEIELAIYALLIQELSDELLYSQEMRVVSW